MLKEHLYILNIVFLHLNRGDKILEYCHKVLNGLKDLKLHFDLILSLTLFLLFQNFDKLLYSAFG